MSKAEARYTLKADDRTARGLRSAESRLQRFRRGAVVGLANAFRRLTPIVAGVGAAMTGWAAMISRTASELDDLAKQAKDLGQSVRDMAEIDLAAELLGTDSNKLIRWWEQIRERAEDAQQKGGEAAETFRQMGLDPAQLAGVEDLATGLTAVAFALERLDASKAVQLRRDLGLSRGAGRVFGQGGYALAEAFGRGGTLGVGTGIDEQARIAEQYRDTWAEIGAIWDKFKRRGFAPDEGSVEMAENIRGILLALDAFAEGGRAVADPSMRALPGPGAFAPLRDPQAPKEKTQERHTSLLEQLNEKLDALGYGP